MRQSGPSRPKELRGPRMRKDEIMKAIGKKMDRYKNPWTELKIQYGQNEGKLYTEECDRFIVSI